MLKFSISLQFLLVFTLISYYIQDVLGDGTITITEAPAYSSLLPCAQKCIFSYNLGCPNVPDPIGNAIGCYDNLNAGCMKVSWAMDSCYCRSDLQAAAVKAISKCVLSQCTVGNSIGDFSSVSNVYAGYCSGAGFAINTAVAASTTVAGGGSAPISNSGAGVPSPTGSTSVPSPSASSSSTSGLSTGSMIGIIVSASSVGIGVIGIAVRIWSTRTKKKMHKEAQARQN